MKEYRLPPIDLVSNEFKTMLAEYPSKSRRDSIPLGVDNNGNIIFKKMSELEDILVGGTTGTGKTNFLNNIICSILMKQKPSETKLVLIDTKGYEFNDYAGVPHLLTPLVRETIHTSQILNSLLTGALNRKKIFARNKVKTFDQYNNLVRKTKKKDPESKLEHLPNIVLVIDDYALMDNQANKKLLEDLLKINNFTGIHVICGTSLPTEDIISKEMDTYFYTRISFNFVEDDYIRFILGTEEVKHIEGENNYICKTKDNTFYDLQNILLDNKEIIKITDYIKQSNK